MNCCSIFRRCTEHLHEALFPRRCAVVLQRWVAPFVILTVLVFYALLASHNALSYEWMTHECPMRLDGVPDKATFFGWMRAIFNPRGYESNGSALYYLYDALANWGLYSIYSLRFLATASGLVALGALAFLFCGEERRRTGRSISGVGLYTLALLAFNVLFLGYTSFARFYAFNVACCALALVFLVKACWRNSLVLWLGYALALGLSVSSMVMSLALVVVHACIVLGIADHKAKKRFLVCAAIGVVLFAFLWAADWQGASRMQDTRYPSVTHDLWQSLLLNGSREECFPSWMTHLDFCATELTYEHTIGCWLDSDVFLLLRQVSALIWAVLLGLGLYKGYRFLFSPPGVFTPALGDLITWGLMVLSVLFMLAFWLTGFRFKPLDISWLCPFIAIAWANVLVRYAPLRYLFLITLLSLPGYYWMGTYAQCAPIVRTIKQFENRRHEVYALSAVQWNVPIDRRCSTRFLSLMVPEGAHLPYTLELPLMLLRNEYLVFDRNTRGLSLLASELRSWPYLYQPQRLPGLLVMLGEGDLDKSPECDYFKTVLIDLQRRHLAEVRWDKRQLFFWLRPLPSPCAAAQKESGHVDMPPRIRWIPNTVRAPRWNITP